MPREKNKGKVSILLLHNATVERARRDGNECDEWRSAGASISINVISKKRIRWIKSILIAWKQEMKQKARGQHCERAPLKRDPPLCRKSGNDWHFSDERRRQERFGSEKKEQSACCVNDGNLEGRWGGEDDRLLLQSQMILTQRHAHKAKPDEPLEKNQRTQIGTPFWGEQ